MIGSSLTGIPSVHTAGGAAPGGDGPGPTPSDAAPLAWGPTQAGTSLQYSRADHQHPSPAVADAAALALLDASTMAAGTYVYVVTLKCWFKLEPSTQATVPLVRIAALNNVGSRWLRDALSPAWWSQTTWEINSSTGNDENDGTAPTPLRTWAELSRRLYCRRVIAGETQPITVNLRANLADTDFVTMYWSTQLPTPTPSITVNGQQTALLTATITATAINRAAGVRNTIQGTGLGAHVGRLVRLQGTTTTTAVIMRAVDADTVELSEQSTSAAGALGPGFTTGQTVEVISQTRVGGAMIGPGINVVSFNDCDFNPAQTCRIESLDGAWASFSFARCYIRGTAFSVFAQNLAQFTACSFHVATASLNCTTTLQTSAQVNQTSTGISLNGVRTSATGETSLISHTSEASTLTVNNGHYAHVSGGGSGMVGVFNLAAGQTFANIGPGAQFDAGTFWGSGNSATAIVVTKQMGGIYSGPRRVTTPWLISGLIGVRVQVSAGPTNIDIPINECPFCVGPNQQPGAQLKFTGLLIPDAGGTAVTYCTDTMPSLLTVNEPNPIGYPVSETLFFRLKVRLRTGNETGESIVVTVYKNGAPTSMLVTIPDGSIAGQVFTDTDHPTLFDEDDAVDLRADVPAAEAGGVEFTATIERAV